MASIESRNGKQRIVFYFGGQKYSRTLGQCSHKTARLALAQVEDNLRRVELGTLAVPPDADIASVLLSSGSVTQQLTLPKAPVLPRSALSG